MSKITEFIVQPNDIDMHSNSLDLDFKVKDITLKRSKAEKSYYDISNLQNISALKVIKVIGKKEIDIELKDYMLDSLKNFLIEDSFERDSRFDCADFAHMLNNIDYSEGFDFDSWHIKAIDNIKTSERKDFLIGDTVLLIEKKALGKGQFTIGKANHFAIFIGDGLYISKFGTDKIIVTNAKEMVKAFTGNKYLRLRPRKDKQIDNNL